MNVSAHKTQVLKTLIDRKVVVEGSQVVVLCQLVTNPCCSSAVNFCNFVPHLTGHETINILEICSGVHSLWEDLKKIGVTLSME